MARDTRFGDWLQRTAEQVATLGGRYLVGRMTGFEENPRFVWRDGRFEASVQHTFEPPNAPIIGAPEERIDIPGVLVPGFSGTVPINEPVVPPQTQPQTVPDTRTSAPAPARSPYGIPRARLPSIPGLLLDQWLELWRQYLTPQPIPWPGRHERKPPKSPPRTTAPEEWLPRPVEWPGTVTQLPFWGPFPADFPMSGPSPADVREPRESPSPSGRPQRRAGPSYDPYVVGPGDWWSVDPSTQTPWPTSEPVRAPARRTRPQAPQMPWPTELLPFSAPRTQPRTSPRTQPRTTPRPPSTQPSFPSPTPVGFADPLITTGLSPLDSPAMIRPPSNPCTAAATDAKREQRKRREKCKEFMYKTILVCADGKPKEPNNAYHHKK